MIAAGSAWLSLTSGLVKCTDMDGEPEKQEPPRCHKRVCFHLTVSSWDLSGVRAHGVFVQRVLMSALPHCGDMHWTGQPQLQNNLMQKCIMDHVSGLQENDKKSLSSLVALLIRVCCSSLWPPDRIDGFIAAWIMNAGVFIVEQARGDGMRDKTVYEQHLK